MPRQKRTPAPTILDEARDAIRHTPFVEQFTSDLTPEQWARKMRAGRAPNTFYWVMVWVLLILISAAAVAKVAQNGFDLLTGAELLALGIVWILVVRATILRRKRR